MKRFKSGFTLAEVLITLTIIGIIAATTLPTTLSNYQSKVVGTQLSKFITTLENASLPFVGSNGSFDSPKDASDFVNEVFVVKNVIQRNGNTSNALDENSSMDEWGNWDKTIHVLKDGTAFSYAYLPESTFVNRKDIVDQYKYGLPRLGFRFFTNINGLPSFAQKSYSVIVTDTGYVFPNDNDDCTWAIYDDDFKTKTSTFSEGSSCVAKELSEVNTNSIYLSLSVLKEESGSSVKGDIENDFDNNSDIEKGNDKKFDGGITKGEIDKITK